MVIALALVVLIALAFAFAFSIGAHYTGACMGMPYAAHAIRAGPALLLLAPLAFLGALLASEGVETTVGHGLLGAGAVSIPVALAIVGSALALTSAYNFLTIPTSTIQILVFSTVGVGLAVGAPVHWATIGSLVVLWAVAPFAAFGLGFLYTKFADARAPPAVAGAPLAARTATALVVVGSIASFAMGANDVANASGALVMTREFGLVASAALGGVGLALGAVTWGRPLLERVAFRVVPLDGRMATASQFAQSTVILVSVVFGAFTSMNQALVGAMIGSGYARGRHQVPWTAIRDILAGWSVGPVSGAALGFGVATLLRSAGLV